jgi:SulP family sulfate permease
MQTETKGMVQTLRPDRGDLKADAIAALTFAIVNIPQAMGQALLATVNPVLGIYTLMVAVPIGALFTSSVFMNVSPTSALAVAAAAGLVEVPDDQKALALAALVFLAGVIQLLAGLFRLGFIVRFVSNAVMTGFLNGVAVLIILGQLDELTGYQSPFSNSVARALDLLLNIGQVDVPTTIIGGLSLALIVVLLRTRLQKFAFIIAIGLMTVALAVLTRVASNTMLSWDSVALVGDIATIPRSLPPLAFPPPSLMLSMLLPALSVAIIGLIQGAGVSQAYPNPDGKYPDVSRDFLGQGAANIATSFVGGVPAGGSISGTALSMSAGARSRWANILSGFFVAAIVLLAAPLVELVPMPSLAALLIIAGVQGLRIPQAMTIWNTSRVSSVVMVMTFIATLLIPLQYAVLIGVALSVVLHVFRQSNKVVVTEIVPVPGGYPEERRAPSELPSGQLTMLMLYGSLFFAAAKNLEEMLPAVDKTRHAVIALGLRGKSEIGSTFVTVLQRYAEALHAGDNRLMLVGVEDAVHSQLRRTGLLALVGEENIFMATPRLGEAMNQAAMAAYAWLGKTDAPTLDMEPPAGTAKAPLE